MFKTFYPVNNNQVQNVRTWRGKTRKELAQEIFISCSSLQLIEKRKCNRVRWHVAREISLSLSFPIDKLFPGGVD
jgi:DNA-binding XRE family transcriptional regulator